MDWLTENPTLLAAVCTALGALLLKLVEPWVTQRAERRADRADYRAEVEHLNDRIDKLESEIFRLRDLYFAAQEENSLLRSTMIIHGITPPARPFGLDSVKED